MASKREREEDNAVFKALQELESVIDRDSDTLKIQVSPSARLTLPVECGRFVPGLDFGVLSPALPAKGEALERPG